MLFSAIFSVECSSTMGTWGWIHNNSFPRAGDTLYFLTYRVNRFMSENADKGQSGGEMRPDCLKWALARTLGLRVFPASGMPNVKYFSGPGASMGGTPGLPDATAHLFGDIRADPPVFREVELDPPLFERMDGGEKKIYIGRDIATSYACDVLSDIYTIDGRDRRAGDGADISGSSAIPPPLNITPPSTEFPYHAARPPCRKTRNYPPIRPHY